MERKVLDKQSQRNGKHQETGGQPSILAHGAMHIRKVTQLKICGCLPPPLRLHLCLI